MLHLSAENLVWSVDDKLILNGIDFTANIGETVGILGPNGAGKTSFLKCLYREHTPQSGKITLSETALTAFTRREIAQKISVVSQHREAVFNLSVLDVVKMGLIPHKQYFDVNTQADYALLHQAIERVDLKNKKHQVFNTLSGGEQQRCFIARAIVQQPEILIMDEPTNHLDIFYQHQILSIVKALDLTLVMSIHDLNLAALFCDRIMLMSDGEVLAFDTPETVLKASLLEQVFKIPCVVDDNPITGKLRVSFGEQR
ncbi:ABC transporter ATP-binding protein [Thalassotalea sp. 1_MG-2023]|uniref:ABC transporter ATP-binding protein n=1 Tax=Thalassotalea sp. 1_MG-2023 TaxID=3062680 RepID=UPI0026E2C466|nr:ABC transporter ATP-binding protein [Thalassotalea sp. 1_MG-2023]MDO6427022.1 ABC transporter ATP-binding protein [Thalassotalea sp. 1_MG-2023]